MVILSALTIMIVLYVLVTLSFIMILVRMALCWRMNRRWTTEDAWMSVALFFLVGLWYSGHGIKYDTNNVLHPERLSAEQIRRREMGSKTVLVGRFCYASAIWAMKFCILAVYARIVDKQPKYQMFIWYIWASLFLTWVASVVVTLFECRPFNHYWQVYPSPATGCKTAHGQIYVVGICNMATDFILIIYPIPIVFRTRLPLRRKLEICTLFSLGFIIITISSLRIWLVTQHGSLQRWRTMFGSIELFAACCVTNCPVFYRLIMDKTRTRNTTKNISITTGNSSSFGRSVGQPQRISDDGDLELGEVRSGSVEVGGGVGMTPTKCSSTDVGMWEVGEHGSQEFLEVR